MKIIACRIGRSMKIEEIESTLEAQQAFVGGYIECADLAPGLVLTCNEDGKFSCPPNRLWYVDGRLVDVIHGDFFVTRIDSEGENIDIQDGDRAIARRAFDPYKEDES